MKKLNLFKFKKKLLKDITYILYLYQQLGRISIQSRQKEVFNHRHQGLFAVRPPVFILPVVKKTMGYIQVRLKSNAVQDTLTEKHFKQIIVL